MITGDKAGKGATINKYVGDEDATSRQGLPQRLSALYKARGCTVRVHSAERCTYAMLQTRETHRSAQGLSALYKSRRRTEVQQRLSALYK